MNRGYQQNSTALAHYTKVSTSGITLRRSSATMLSSTSAILTFPFRIVISCKDLASQSDDFQNVLEFSPVPFRAVTPLTAKLHAYSQYPVARQPADPQHDMPGPTQQEPSRQQSAFPGQQFCFDPSLLTHKNSFGPQAGAVMQLPFGPQMKPGGQQTSPHACSMRQQPVLVHRCLLPSQHSPWHTMPVSTLQQVPELESIHTAPSPQQLSPHNEVPRQAMPETEHSSELGS
jgi:hypothetical protein